MKKFSGKISAFGSMTSLALLFGMIACFFLALPAMWLTTLGKIFACLWAGMTALAAVAHLYIFNQRRKEIRLRRKLDKISRELLLKHRRERQEKRKSYLRT